MSGLDDFALSKMVRPLMDTGQHNSIQRFLSECLSCRALCVGGGRQMKSRTLGVKCVFYI